MQSGAPLTFHGRWPARAAAAFCLAMALACAGAQAASAYVNPFPADVSIGRTDMGVDACMTPGETIRAVGDGVVVGVMKDWYAGQPYVWYQLTSGPDAGRFVYVAEQIRILVRIGQSLTAGEVVARYARQGTCTETGWSEASGETTAAATTGYSEGEVTRAGASFARFLISLGVPGQYELQAARSSAHAKVNRPATTTPTVKARHKAPAKKKRPTERVPPYTTGVDPLPPANSGAGSAGGQPSGGSPGNDPIPNSGASGVPWPGEQNPLNPPSGPTGHTTGSTGQANGPTGHTTGSTSGASMPSWTPGATTYAGQPLS